MRTELFHPILVHFPLALLLVGSILRLAHFFLRKKLSLYIAWSFLVIGVCFSWLAIMTGEIAEDIVRSTLCKPIILDYHMNLAYFAASFYTTAVFIDCGRFLIKRLQNSQILLWIMSLLYISATAILIIVGFLGGSLVFDQGAAVKKVCSL